MAGLRFDTGTNMIPWRFLKRFSCFAAYQRQAVSRTERGRIRRRIFRKPVTNRSDRTRGPIDWHIILMVVRVIAGANPGAAAALIYLDPACPAHPPAQLSLHVDANARRYTKSSAYPPGDPAISWIKFRVAVNLDHLLRHGKHNFRLSFANKHGPRDRGFPRAPFSVPNKFFFSPLRVIRDRRGGTLKRVIYAWPFANCSLCQFHLSGGVTRFSGIFSLGQTGRAAPLLLRDGNFTPEFAHRRVIQFQI